MPDSLFADRAENVAQHISHPRLKLISAFMLDQQIVADAVVACDAVCHLPAAVGVRYIVSDPVRAEPRR